MMEHLNQTTKPPLLVNKAGEIRIAMKFSEKQLMERKRGVNDETKDDTSKDNYDAGREDSEVGKTDKENTGAPHSKLNYYKREYATLQAHGKKQHASHNIHILIFMVETLYIFNTVHVILI
jgi:hypothetical protein